MRTINIINGPSREELFDGLRLHSENRLVPFKIKTRGGTEVILQAIINRIEAEDASGQSWNLRLHFNEDVFTKGAVPELCNMLNGLKAYFSTKKRTGALILK